MNNERKITRIYNPLKMFYVNIAVYCRVSTTHEKQKESLNNQIEYYKSMISRRLDWKLVDFYIDIQSGKNSTDRPEFQRMLKDCRNKKIDLIITKSVSRFGRNTADTHDTINNLRSLGIDVLFEIEDIRISETNKEFLLTVIEAVAQAESESRSQNIKWGIKRHLEKGTSKLYNRKCYGYINDTSGNIIINEPEAKVVKNIFNLYLCGYSTLGIIKELKNEGLKSPTGKEQWAKRTIETILSNEKYIGNVLVGKTYSNDFPDNERKINKGESTKYLISDSHPPIITLEQFERVQAEKLRRSNIQKDGFEIKRKTSHYSMKKSIPSHDGE